MGRGALVELIDGSVKYDLITGIGFNLLGHAHPELISEQIDASVDSVMQGNLEPGIEAKALLRELLASVENSRLRKGWFATCGTMANELALKIVRQRKSPATGVLAFRECFAGRSTAMQEVTDNPKYREGQPTYGEVSYLDFYDPTLGVAASVERTCLQIKEQVNARPGHFAVLMLELVQGEGGIRFAPPEYYRKIFEFSRDQGLFIWVDEIQTFARTGELFAFQTFGLDSWVDLVTVGKALQACAVLFTDELNPKAGLIAGTFAGSVGALRSGKRMLQVLKTGNFLGKEGLIQKRSDFFVASLQRRSKKLPGLFSEIRAIGAMIAIQVFDGGGDITKKVLLKLFDRGVIAFYCGHDPYFIRFLPPFGVMTEAQIEDALDLFEKTVLEVKEESFSA
jgi:4-aminobutyrate aminotransferase-like enzyme